MKIWRLFLSGCVLMLLFTSCFKAESYCELPPRIISTFEFGSNSEVVVHAPSDVITLYTGREEEEGTTSEGVLYSFSTPSYFINPKGDYTEDIVQSEQYDYRLKDTLVYADTIPISIYSFNDCGRSVPFETYILFE